MKLSDIFGSPEEEAARAIWPDMARQAGLDPDAHRLDFLLSRESRDEIRILLTVDGPGGALLLKHAPNLGAAWFAQQVTAHRRAEAAFQGVDGLGVPRLLVADPKHQAFLMERVPGVTAQVALRETKDTGERLAILTRCGRWLGQMHRASEAQFCRFQPTNTVDQIRWLRRQEVVAPEMFLALAEAALGAVRGAAGCKTIRRHAHGDMHLDNLILEPDGRMMGIDFCKTDPDYPARDLAYLLVHYVCSFALADPDGLRTDLSMAKDALLTGYDGRWRDRSILEPLTLVEILRMHRTIRADPLRRTAFQRQRWARLEPLTDLALEGRLWMAE